MATRDRVTLFYRAGSSDKVYSTWIEEKGHDAFVVNFAYGRRGSTLQTGTKTETPLPYEQAKKVFDKLVKSKTDKGYSPGPDGTPYQGTENEERDTGLRPQLLNPITEEEAEQYLDNPIWWMQEKIDGKRILIRKVGREVVGINRKGLTVALPQPIVEHALSMGGDFTLDGEAVGDRILVFDCLLIGAVNLATQPYRDRWLTLTGLVKGKGAIEILPTVATMEDKRDFFRFMRERKSEGVVFKDRSAPYTSGRPASGGPQVKLKFYATCSAIVAKGRLGKRSVGLELLDGTKRVAIGNVTIPANHAVPKAGSVAEIRYLYANLGGALYQPVYLGVRDDLDQDACTVKQLKYRPTGGENEDES